MVYVVSTEEALPPYAELCGVIFRKVLPAGMHCPNCHDTVPIGMARVPAPVPGVGDRCYDMELLALLLLHHLTACPKGPHPLVIAAALFPGMERWS